MRNSNVLLGLLGTLMVLVIGFSGCQQASVTSSSKQEIVLEFWTLQLSNFAPVLTPMFTAYEKTHPGIKINWVDVPFSEGEKRTLTTMLSPNVPDVVNLNPDFSAILANRKALLNLNEWVTPEIKQQYLPVAWQAASIELTEKEESPKPFAFGFPWYLTSKITLYNQALLKQVGWVAPPQTYDELEKLAIVLKEKKIGSALMPTLTENGAFLKQLVQLGVPIFNAKGIPDFAANPKAIELLSFWVRLYQQKLIPAESLTEGHRAAIDRYQSGQLALLLSGANFLTMIQENAPALYNQTAVAPQFPAEIQMVDFAMMVLVVPAKSKHPKEAVEFATFMTNTTNQLAFSKQAPVLPSTTAALKDVYFSDLPSPQTPAVEAKMITARVMSAQQLLKAKTTLSLHPQQKTLNQIMDYHVQAALMGKLTPQEALSQTEQKMKTLLQ